MANQLPCLSTDGLYWRPFAGLLHQPARDSILVNREVWLDGDGTAHGSSFVENTLWRDMLVV